MKSQFTFKSMESSDELIQYAETQLGKLRKFELKPIELAHMVFKWRAHGECEVELVLTGPHLSLQAHARADNFPHAVDQAIDKVASQMARIKDKVQHHKGG